jgi:class 3 adenylate cyclase
MLQWATENKYKMRVGVATGDVGSGIFGDGESRPAWDVLGECVNLASRMESCGEEGYVQITETTMSYLHDPRLRALFSPR